MRKMLSAAAALAFCAGAATAGEDSVLDVEGEIFFTQTAAPAHMENVDTIYSGWVFRTDETQALQMDDFDNPSFVFIDQALDQWETAEGSEGKACADCHADEGPHDGRFTSGNSNASTRFDSRISR